MSNEPQQIAKAIPLSKPERDKIRGQLIQDNAPSKGKSSAILTPVLVELAELKMLGYSSKILHEYAARCGFVIGYHGLNEFVKRNIGLESGPDSKAAKIVEAAVNNRSFVSAAFKRETGLTAPAAPLISHGKSAASSEPQTPKESGSETATTENVSATTSSNASSPATIEPAKAESVADSSTGAMLDVEAAKRRKHKIMQDSIAAIQNESFGAIARSGVLMQK